MRGIGFGEDSTPIRSSVWTIRLALFSLALLLLTIIFHRIFGMSTLVALNLFTLAFVGCGLVCLVGLFALVRIWQRGWRGASNAVTGMVLALLMLAWPVGAILSVPDLPAINDVTTDVANPPVFRFMAEKRPRGANPIDYPREFAELQSPAYKDLRAIAINRPPQEAMDLTRQALQRMRIVIGGETPVGELGPGWGQIEGVDRTLVLGFYDDVVVRVQEVRGGSKIDIRSASRFGRHDFGANAARIRAIQTEIIARVEATVPASQRRSRRGQTN